MNLGSGYSVPTLDEIVTEIKAAGTNMVKLNLTVGALKNATDNAYDPALPFPLGGTPANIIAFGQKLTAQGIPCLMWPVTGVEGTFTGQLTPTDPSAFMAQHIPRLVQLAQMAESAGCEYFVLYDDHIENLTVDPTLVDLWGRRQLKFGPCSVGD